MRERCRFVLILAALSIAGVSARARADDGPAANKSTQEEVDRLLVQVASDDFQVREQARQRLVALGAAARPALEAHREDKDPEIRRTVFDLLSTMGATEPVGEPVADLTALEVVTLEDEGPVADVLHRWETAHGGRFRFLLRLPATVVKVDAKARPWFEVLDGILERAGLDLRDGFDQSGLADLVARKADAPSAPVAYAGPFRLEVETVTVARSLKNAGPRTYSIGLRLSWTPNVLVAGTGLPVLVRAVDPTGKAYVSRWASPDPTRVSAIGSSRRSTDLSLSVEAADPAAAEDLAVAEVEIRLHVRYGREEVRFDDLGHLPATRSAPRTRGMDGQPGTATLHSFGPDPDHAGWLVGNLTATLPQGVPGDAVLPLVEVSDGSVRTLFDYGSRSVSSDGVLQLTVRAAGIPADATPTKVLVSWLAREGQGLVRFVLKGVPLR